jgi:heme exporter protein A
MIETIALSKTFGTRRALDGVSFTVPTGESVAIVGPNGAGKTTLLRCLATLMRPTAGSVRIDGLDISRSADAIRGHIGFLSDSALVYGDLTADQNLRFFARLYGLADGAARADALLAKVGLASRRHDQVRAFSRGMRQRLELARALLHRPSILLLDEPYSGLDSRASEMLTTVLRDEIGHATTVLHATHNLAQALSLAGRVLVLARGQIVLDGPTAGLDPATFAAVFDRAIG